MLELELKHRVDADQRSKVSLRGKELVTNFIWARSNEKIGTALNEVR